MFSAPNSQRHPGLVPGSTVPQARDTRLKG